MFFLSRDAAFFWFLLWPLSSQVQKIDSSKFAQHLKQHMKDLLEIDSKFLTKISRVTAEFSNADQSWLWQTIDSIFKAEFISSRKQAFRTTWINLRYNLELGPVLILTILATNLCDVYNSTCIYKLVDLQSAKLSNDHFKTRTSIITHSDCWVC